MSERGVAIYGIALSLLFLAGCRDKTSSTAEPTTRGLPAVPSSALSRKTSWDSSAGPFILVSLGDDVDSGSIASPETADTSTEISTPIKPTIAGTVFDLFNRSGKIASSSVTPLRGVPDTNRDCMEWPVAQLQTKKPGWRVGFVAGRVNAIPLDSIEDLSSVDSAALAASLAKSAATLPASSDPTFRRLPFRVRFAYQARLDSSEMVIADVVRALNEEANPRVEDLFLVGERPAGTSNGYIVRYYNRTAGPEETMQATEVLTAVQLVSSNRVAVVVNVESENGWRVQIIEPADSGVWRPSWVSVSKRC
jgi:hypothetical protein